MNIVVYCGSSFGDNPAYETAARELGTWIGAHGHKLVYGGSSVGLMGVVSKAVMDAGGQVMGVEPRFFIEAGVAQHDLTQLIVVETMSERKATMIDAGDAFVALPGGVGTLEEISEIATRIHLGLGRPACCILADIEGYWQPLAKTYDAMVQSGFLSSATREKLHVAGSIAEVTDILSTWEAAH